MPDPTPLDACFIVNPDISHRSLAPKQRRAKRSSYYPEQGFGAFPDEISQECGPDRSVYLMGARWEGETGMASQQDDMRDGYFISARKTGPWRWVLWRCSWDDNESAWWWSSAGATSWSTTDPAAAGSEMIRRLWASWGSQGAPEEIDEFGLIDRFDIERLVDDVFDRQPEMDMEPVTDTAGPDEDSTAGSDVTPPDPAPDAQVILDTTDSAALAATSDADLARILGIHYQAATLPEQPAPMPEEPSSTGERLNSISKARWATSVLSFPPEKPMIQGKPCADRYSDRISARITSMSAARVGSSGGRGAKGSVIYVIMIDLFESRQDTRRTYRPLQSWPAKSCRRS